jgi:methylated-DNA-[protein]-cysteine S-methyltransferase
VTYFYKTVETPVEALKLVASHKGLAAILWENDDPKRVRLGELLEAVDHPILERAEDQISEYFAGTRRSFDIDLDLVGGPCRKPYLAGS